MSSTAIGDTKPQALDDVMLAMDIVDTLRHRDLVLAKELGGGERKEAMIRRLKEIYYAQGIEVPDQILEDGVRALEEQRFTYDPPKDSFSIKLARAYINRGRWGPPLAFIAGAALFLTATYEYGFDRPREAKAERERIELSVTLPKEIASARDAALSLTGDNAARARIETSYQDGIAAAKAGDQKAARAAVGDLQFLTGVLGADLTIRVFNDPSQPAENSGVFRINDDAPGVRNYYLIVEAVDSRGRTQSLEIRSEEDKRTERVDRWGVRVPEAIFDAVASDKSDDLIIEDDVIGKKPRGALQPSYDIATVGGAILEW